MTSYIVWAKSCDSAFRSAYFAVTGERIEAAPQEDAAGVRLMAGSSRISPAQAGELVNMPDFPGLYIGSGIPAGWMPREDSGPG